MARTEPFKSMTTAWNRRICDATDDPSPLETRRSWSPDRRGKLDRRVGRDPMVGAAMIRMHEGFILGLVLVATCVGTIYWSLFLLGLLR